MIQPNGRYTITLCGMTGVTAESFRIGDRVEIRKAKG
jgi:hypothetical protein